MTIHKCEIHNPAQVSPGKPPHPASEQGLFWLQEGNQQFRDHMNIAHQGFFEQSAKGQNPPFMIIACSDSRVSEDTVFNMMPGSIFASRNISNQFHSSDNSACSTLAYAVSELGVEHVIVLGHYGCGGVKAAMSSPPEPPIDAGQGVIQAWVEPIRKLFYDSARHEISVFREEHTTGNDNVGMYTLAWRALVEENVKATVARIARSSVIVNHFAKLDSAETARNWRTGDDTSAKPVFVHGWVYDINDGKVYDLNMTVGPPGIPLPKPPFPNAQ